MPMRNTEIEKVPVYTKKEIEEIYNAQDAEEIRGANPRYWEDVKVGDELEPGSARAVKRG